MTCTDANCTVDDLAICAACVSENSAAQPPSTIRISDDLRFAVVCDAVRRSQDDAQAASTALKSIWSALEQQTFDSSLAARQKILQIICDANRDVLQQNRQHGRPHAGSSLGLFFRISRRIYIKNVGNCRAYVLRRNRLRQLTRDHSLSQLVRAAGNHTAQSASLTAGHDLLNFLGCHDFVPTDDFSSLDLAVGDRILLCSHALATAASDNTAIRNIMNSQASPDVVARNLMHEATKHGAPSGAACVVLHVTHNSELHSCSSTRYVAGPTAATCQHRQASD